tara:strand:- start:7139 stop:7405 length:267 start_codon:yes stop_codon:yes gene_type:complete
MKPRLVFSTPLVSVKQLVARRMEALEQAEKYADNPLLHLLHTTNADWLQRKIDHKQLWRTDRSKWKREYLAERKALKQVVDPNGKAPK